MDIIIQNTINLSIIELQNENSRLNEQLELGKNLVKLYENLIEINEKHLKEWHLKRLEGVWKEC